MAHVFAKFICGASTKGAVKARKNRFRGHCSLSYSSSYVDLPRLHAVLYNIDPLVVHLRRGCRLGGSGGGGGEGLTSCPQRLFLAFKKCTSCPQLLLIAIQYYTRLL